VGVGKGKGTSFEMRDLELGSKPSGEGGGSGVGGDLMRQRALKLRGKELHRSWGLKRRVAFLVLGGAWAAEVRGVAGRTWEQKRESLMGVGKRARVGLHWTKTGEIRQGEAVPLGEGKALATKKN